MILCLGLVAVPPLGAGPLTESEADNPENARWASVMPQPLQRTGPGAPWVVGPLVLVDWGELRASERADLSDGLDGLFARLGRRWRTAEPGERASLSFGSVGGVGEGYQLAVGPRGAWLGSEDPRGRFYALMTLVQLLPPRASATERVAAAGGRTIDRPELAWRGLMIDSSRHFQSVASLEWILELMALHKLNRFHWHLTDDQGWRLEIPSWPRLTEVGAWRTEADGRRSGGYYTAADVRRIVSFAARRHIVVVPEIDLPGHASAALASYPELSALGTHREVPLDWGVPDGVLSIGRPSVRSFTRDLLLTLKTLFPGPYIHWGGDEVYRTPWMRNAESLEWMRSVEVSSPSAALAQFWTDLAKSTLAAGKTPIGWDDVALLDSPQGTILQWWDDPARALVGIREGHPYIASWKESVYLDYPELDGDGDRAWWMPVQTLERVAAQPLWPPGTPVELRRQLLGVEAVLFTERAPEPRLGRKLFPRLSLIAETAWRAVPGGVPGWRGRVDVHRERLEAWGVGMLPPLR